jgi:integrase/recombinase XerD
LFRERKLDANTVNQRTGALRFFLVATLKKSWSIAETPYPRKVFRLPKILSPEQVARLIEAASTPLYRALLMALYATGLRPAELAHLKVSDIDSQRMVIHVNGGKGRKDRSARSSAAQECAWLFQETGSHDEALTVDYGHTAWDFDLSARCNQ